MRFRLTAAAALLLFVLGLIVGSPAHAQTSKGILAGVARDESGAVIPNATLTATNQDTGETRTTATLKDGAYRIEALTAGPYTITASQSGFKSFKASDVSVRTSVVTSLDVTFSVGGGNETVTVEANASTGINTENGQLAGVIGSRQLSTLPIFSLNPIEVATTVPGVQIVSQGAGFSNGVNIEVNGARPRANNFLLDGQEINDVGIGGQAFQPTIPDIFQSFAVITNSASAEYGRAGGAVVNLVTKSGTNDFHGTVFERYAGSGLNSLDGNLRQGIIHGTKPAGYIPPKKARFDLHTYGFTAGGPIIKDKLFAFGALQFQRYYGKVTPIRIELPDANGYALLQTLGGQQATQVKLLDSYLSNGSYLKDDVNFPTAGPNRDGIVSKINIVGAAPVTTGYFQRQNAPSLQPDTQWMYRIDFNPREKDNFSFRYLHDRSSTSPDFGNNGAVLVGFDTLEGGPVELGAGTWTHVFSPTIVNEFRASEARLGFLFAPTPETLANPLYSLATIAIPNIAVTSGGATQLGPNQNFPQGRHEDLYQLQDTVGLTRGRQSFRIGFDIGRLIETDVVSLNAKGTLGFVAGGTGVSGLGNFLLNQLGPSGTATKVFGSTRVDPHGWRSGVFAQDDIKLNPQLTVNLGIRYDYLTNPENSLKYPAVDVAHPFNAIDAVVPVQNDRNNISPRAGFAYSPKGRSLGDGKMVIRGGFGIFYDSSFSNITVNSAQSAPNAVAGLLTQTTGNGLPNATDLITSIKPTLSPTSAVTSEANNAVNPMTYQYNLGIEQQLPGQIVFGLRYVGSRAKNLYASQQYNYFSNGARLNPTRGQINVRDNSAESNYNSLQVDLTHAFSHGLQINGDYVFGKALDTGSEIFNATGVPTVYAANLAPSGRAGEYGPSGYDHRHYVSISYVWSPAGFHAANALSNAALGLFTRNWTISGIEQFQSGTYTTFSQTGTDSNGDGSTANDRPLIGNPVAPLASAGIDGHFLKGGTTGVYYDVASAINGSPSKLNIVQPGAVHFLIPYQPNNEFLTQELSRNSFKNPGTTLNNISVQKGFGMAFLHFDRGQFLLRAEARNVGNHNDVGILDANVRDIGSSFLDVSSARRSGGPTGNRQIVLWAKVVF